jgi:hypothetical protein
MVQRSMALQERHSAIFPYVLMVSGVRDRISGQNHVESYCFLLRRTV